MGRGASGYVNLLSHSPVNTPCPGYRYRESREALLEDMGHLVATTPPAVSEIERRLEVLCPVEIHVHDPAIRERKRQSGAASSSREESSSKGRRKWIDLDENLADGYILIDDDCIESRETPDETEEAPFPDGKEDIEPYDEEDDEDDEDADSHGKGSLRYTRLGNGASRKPPFFEFDRTYPLANSHGNAYQEPSSHLRYSELYSEISLGNYSDGNRDDGANYSVANSHGEQGTLLAKRDSRENEVSTDDLAWDARQQSNYQVANSHSNYRVFYDSRTQQRDFLHASAWPDESSWRERVCSNAGSSSMEDVKQRGFDPSNDRETTAGSSVETKSDSDQGTEETGCDIEQCLVQIEESLLNIEQNLLHVQDLDIPELRNLLYKSPSIEKSLFEVQDILYADAITPGINKCRSLLSLETEKQRNRKKEDDEEDDEEVDDDDEEEEEEVWVDRDLTIKDNDDENGDPGAGPFDASNEESSDTTNAEENNQSGSMDERNNFDSVDGSTVFREEAVDSNYMEKTMNFVPNSLGRTLPRRVVLDGTKENIRMFPEESTLASIDYNLNSACSEKKLLCRDKCHSRTSSLRENSKFSNLDPTDRHDTGKSSLQNLPMESTKNSLDSTNKAKSESTLQNPPCGHEDDRWIQVEAKTKDFRKRIASITAHRYKLSGLDAQRKPKMILKETTAKCSTYSREKSPPKLQDKDKEPAGETKAFDKKKRKKISSRSQSSAENALVPSKLISLSLSLLLAALLQAVRCLTDLVEDAFRSVSYDRSGLLQ